MPFVSGVCRWLWWKRCTAVLQQYASVAQNACVLATLNNYIDDVVFFLQCLTFVVFLCPALRILAIFSPTFGHLCPLLVIFCPLFSYFAQCHPILPIIVKGAPKWFESGRSGLKVATDMDQNVLKVAKSSERWSKSSVFFLYQHPYGG